MKMGTYFTIRKKTKTKQRREENNDEIKLKKIMSRIMSQKQLHSLLFKVYLTCILRCLSPTKIFKLMIMKLDKILGLLSITEI